MGGIEMEQYVNYLSQMEPEVKHTMDVLAGVTSLAALLNWLPTIAAVFSVFWISLRIYEHLRWVWRGRRMDEKP